MAVVGTHDQTRSRYIIAVLPALDVAKSDQPVAVEGDHGLASLDLGGNVGDAGATLQCRFVDQPTDFVGELRMILLGKYHVNRIHSHVLLKW